MFFLRDPIARFVSGFYSRQRQGYPMYSSPWNAEEAVAYKNFTTPNDLGIALSSVSPERQQQAREAMGAIEHVRNSYWDWIDCKDELLSRRDDILFIGFQETLSDDFDSLKELLGLPPGVQLPSKTQKQSHVNPEHLDKSLDDVAIKNLSTWYRKDFEFIGFCKETILS